MATSGAHTSAVKAAPVGINIVLTCKEHPIISYDTIKKDNKREKIT